MLTDPDGPVYAPGAFELALGDAARRARDHPAFRTGEGLGWHEHDAGVFTGCERFFRPGYVANLAGSWLPALDGVVARLRDGGAAWPTSAAGTAPRRSSWRRSSRAPPSSAPTSTRSPSPRPGSAPRRPASSDRVDFEVASAQSFAGEGFDLVTTFDALHDMGDPLGAARNVRARFAPDGTWMIVEPYAGAAVAENLNPVGRVYYGFSTFLCVPNALSQTGGYALGAQAGEAPMRELAADAGFSRFRRVAETPFNIVYEARP